MNRTSLPARTTARLLTMRQRHGMRRQTEDSSPKAVAMGFWHWVLCFIGMMSYCSHSSFVSLSLLSLFLVSKRNIAGQGCPWNICNLSTSAPATPRSLSENDEKEARSPRMSSGGYGWRGLVGKNTGAFCLATLLAVPSLLALCSAQPGVVSMFSFRV